MNIELVRKIDFWIGIPVCFFLTLVKRILELVSFGKKLDKEPNKFLFIELSEMGSAILAYPAIKYIKRRYPQAELFFMIFSKNKPSVEILKIVPEKNILEIRNNFLFNFFVDVLKNILRLRKEKIDVAFDLELFSRGTAILNYLSGAPKRVGFFKYKMEGLYRGNLLTHKISYNFQQHISKSFFSFARAIEKQFKDSPGMEDIISDTDLERPAFFESTKNNIDKIWRKIKNINSAVESGNKLIVFNPSAGELPIRAWPIERYAELAKKILNDSKCFIISIGGPEDVGIVQKFCNFVNNKRCLNLAGQTTISELIDLYNISDFLITNDSGPAQFASLTLIKNFVFFGPEMPALYSPPGRNTRIIYSNFPCSPCLSAFNHRNTSCRDNKCLQAISVDDVYKLINFELHLQ